MNNILDFISSSAQTRYRSRRNTSEGLRRKPSCKGRGTSQQQQEKAEVLEDPDDPRRPSVEDLALTENLIPPGGKQIYGDEDEDEAPPAEYSVKKLSELDPRYKGKRTSRKDIEKVGECLMNILNMDDTMSGRMV